MASGFSSRKVLKIGEEVLLVKGSKVGLTHTARILSPDRSTVFSQFTFSAGGRGVVCYQNETPLPDGSVFTVGTNPTTIILVQGGRKKRLTVEAGRRGDDLAYVSKA